MKKVFIIILLSLFVYGCSNYQEEEKKYLNIEEIKDIMANNEYIIIDVRTKEEYETIHLVDAINIPYDDINEEIDKDKIIFVYCRSGNRSKIAYDKLKNMGYTVYDLGGIDNIDLTKE